MFNESKKYAVYCAITILAGAAVGMIGFFASERSDAKDSLVSRDFSKAAAKFQAAPMPKLRASPRHNMLPSPATMTNSQQKLLEDTGDSSMKTLALTAMRFSNSNGERTSELKMQVEAMGGKDKKKLEKMKEEVLRKAKNMAGVTEPLGFFDPLGFCSEDGLTEGKLCFYREVEVKHGRVAMLASLGFLVGEQFHPLFGGDIDVPSYLAFQQTPLQTFWPAVVAAIAIPEVFSVFTFEDPTGYDKQPFDRLWQIKSKTDKVGIEPVDRYRTVTDNRIPGDIGFDPLGLKPKDPKELKEMQTKELNNGRLAMIAAAGMIAQELATGQTLF
jgi:hypothetical protein